MKVIANQASTGSAPRRAGTNRMVCADRSSASRKLGRERGVRRLDRGHMAVAADAKPDRDLQRRRQCFRLLRGEGKRTGKESRGLVARRGSTADPVVPPTRSRRGPGDPSTSPPPPGTPPVTGSTTGISRTSTTGGSSRGRGGTTSGAGAGAAASAGGADGKGASARDTTMKSAPARPGGWTDGRSRHHRAPQRGRDREQNQMARPPRPPPRCAAVAPGAPPGKAAFIGVSPARER